MFSAFVVITAWVTLLYVVGIVIGAGCHKHWSDGGGETRFGAGGESPLWVNSSRKHGDQFPAALPPTAHIGLKGTNFQNVGARILEIMMIGQFSIVGVGSIFGRC